jgi:hypothetical protein
MSRDNPGQLLGLPTYRQPGCNTTFYRSFLHTSQYSGIITANIANA